MTDKNEQSYDTAAILQEMRDAYWESIEQGESAQSVEYRDYVVFHLGGERFGIPTTCSREVLRLPRLVQVPRLPEHIRGIVNLRGQIVAVTDLRPLLGLAQRELPQRVQLVVVEAAGLQTALLTEGVEGIHAIAVDTIEPVTEGLAGFPRDAAEGHVATEKGLLVLLDLEHILRRGEYVIDQKGNDL
jgi:purine-binding chemotaxis protein CheW